jgi:uncharacterized membrane protein
MLGLYLRAAVSGLFFGLWPLFMKHSGIKSYAVSTIFLEAVVLSIVLLYGGREFSSTDLSGTKWMFLFLAGATAATGVLAFNSGLAVSNEATVSIVIVTAILVQVIVTAVYQATMGGGLSATKAAGFVLAGISAYILSR